MSLMSRLQMLSSRRTEDLCDCFLSVPPGWTWWSTPSKTFPPVFLQGSPSEPCWSECTHSYSPSTWAPLFPTFFRRENPHDAVVLHPKNVGKSLDTLPAYRYRQNRCSCRSCLRDSKLCACVAWSAPARCVGPLSWRRGSHIWILKTSYP